VVMDLIARAQRGDSGAFAELIDPHRRELHVHCYRILGSVQDAEDVLQETLLAAWQGLAEFEGRSALRTWLYRIATNRCLNALRAASRRPRTDDVRPTIEPPEPTRIGEVIWLEPIPDALLENPILGPEARVEARESISLAFVTALQLLPARQRAVIVLRDVLGFPASEVATTLDASEASVTSALKRARATLRDRLEADAHHDPAPAPNSPIERALVERLTRAYEADDLDGLVALLTEDVWLTMPPVPLEYQGRELAARFFAAVAFAPGRKFKLVPTRANGQPAFGIYVREPKASIFHANGLLVLTLSGERICAMTRFDNGVLPSFGFPRTLAE
jgi:RNA polymerase sigma-70 factor (TIGR02960 family)